MRIAIPVADGKLAMHFGHCKEFAFMDVDPASREIHKTDMVEAPEHQPGLLPRWLAEKNVNQVIAGGMGARAKSLLMENGIQVIVGAPAEEPAKIVSDYLAGTLQTGTNACDH